MSCGKYLELLSARLDGALTEPEERELEAHLRSCPACRAAEAQLAALPPAFAELEDVPAPEGFARGVTERVRKGAIPLFRRPRFKALAGLAACAALTAGLYGVLSPSRQDGELIMRGYRPDALEEGGAVSAGEVLRSVPDFAVTAAGPGTDTPAGETESLFSERQKAAPDEEAAAACDCAAALPSAPVSCTEILVVDRMPDGGWDVIPPETPVSGDGLHVTGELLEQIEQMAREQGITARVTSGTQEAQRYLIVVLEESR